MCPQHAAAHRKWKCSNPSSVQPYSLLTSCTTGLSQLTEAAQRGVKEIQGQVAAAVEHEHTLQPPAHEGRPAVYTREQLAAGEEDLSWPAQPFHSTAELVQHLKRGSTAASFSHTARLRGSAQAALGNQGAAARLWPAQKAASSHSCCNSQAAGMVQRDEALHHQHNSEATALCG